MKDRRTPQGPARRALWLPCVLALGLLAAGCAGAKGTSASRRPAARPPHQADAAPRQAAPLGLDAQKHMAAGAWQSAIDDYDTERQSNPLDQDLIKLYVRSLEDILTAADKASDRSDFAPAGKSYDLLLKNFPKFRTFAPALSFDQAQLDAKRARCRKALAARGFEEYRQGDLDQAIALWRSLLEFDPENTEIKAALQTATLQQKNLQEGAPGR